MQKVNIIISPGLIDQLSGKKTEQKDEDINNKKKKAIQGISAMDKEIINMIRQEKELEYSLKKTKRLGYLLLKKEKEELEKLKEITEESKQEYSRMKKVEPCIKLRESCRECYENNKENIITCQNTIDKYTECAINALKQNLKQN